MPETLSIKLYQSTDITDYYSNRVGEIKVGESISTVGPIGEKPLIDALRDSVINGKRFALLGIPEDIGPRANLGRTGAATAWDAFLKTWLNQQENAYAFINECLLVGHIELTDLMDEAKSLSSSSEEDIEALRRLCEKIDSRVTPVIDEITTAGLEPIIIGGGHNNTLPIQRGIYNARKNDLDGLACFNCDAHADFREMEGRHSGNGFRYAYDEGILKAYYVLSLHEPYNSTATLDALSEADFQFTSYEAISIRKEITFEKTISNARTYLSSKNLPVGLEIDLDSIAYMPSSASTPNGISNSDAGHMIHALASSLPTAYLYLTEAAPSLDPKNGERNVGRTLSLFVNTYLKARMMGVNSEESRST